MSNITISQPQLRRASDLADFRAQAQRMAAWADKQPGAKDFAIEVTRQGAPIRMVVTGAELHAIAVSVAARLTQDLKAYGIEVDRR